VSNLILSKVSLVLQVESRIFTLAEYFNVVQDFGSTTEDGGDVDVNT
jgi:hypothetical protein